MKEHEKQLRQIDLLFKYIENPPEEYITFELYGSKKQLIFIGSYNDLFVDVLIPVFNDKTQDIICIGNIETENDIYLASCVGTQDLNAYHFNNFDDAIKMLIQKFNERNV